MFLLVSVRHVGAHPGEHQHGVSIQISISLPGKTFLRISRMRNIPLTWILARVFVHVPSFISQILDFYVLKRFWFLFWSILNGVTLKTSNKTFLLEIRLSQKPREAVMGQQGVDCKTVCTFAYSSTREQSNKRSRTRLKTESERSVRLACFACVRLLRHALPISLLILRKKPTVLQSNCTVIRLLGLKLVRLHDMPS